ncbi:MAG: outer membrane beta-barrel family protein [Maribacter sp.]|uniref:outer membrane beta-barrel family protein n=1 Tax=Maribacter sp. TaxID=1897614 RepID=UPI003C789238
MQAQNFSVSGAVKDGDNQSIPFATVFLLQVADTTIVKGVSADENGMFAIQHVLPSTYLIRASYIGKYSDLIGIDVAKDIKMGTLIIEEQVENLEEVVVASVKPKIERKADRLIFNVENTVVSQGSSWDVLKRTPGVIAIGEELQVRNQSATIYINDRKVQLSPQEVQNLLENYPAGHIKLVEVIGNPPAKYDAEGGPVLNIVTNKNISLGYKGNINSTYTQAIFPKYTLGTSHFYKTKKLNLFTSYTYGPRKDFKTIESETNFINDTGIFSRWQTDFDKTSRAKTHTAQLNMDYVFDYRNKLGLTSTALVSPNKDYDYVQFTEMRNAQRLLDSTFITQSDLFEDKNNFSADLTYTHDFKTGGNLQLNGHYTNYDFNSTQNARSDYSDADGQFLRTYGFLTDADQAIEIYTTQLDIVTTLGSLDVETGLKGSFIESKSGIQYFNTTNGSVFISNLSDDYLYDEQVYAGYVSLSKDWEKVSLKTGLRAEHTQSSGFSTSLSEINDLSYFELFPTLHLLYKPHKAHSLSFDYSRKLKRPRYEDLNPFRYYINENNFIEGNPNLLPNFTHSFNLNYTLKEEFFFDFYYRYNDNYISTLAFQDNINLVLRNITQNVLGSNSYGFDFNYGKSVTDRWYLYSYISIFHEDETFVALESENQEVTNTVNGGYIDLTNYLTLSKDGTLKGEVGLTYLSGFLEGSYQQEETTNLNLGLRKTLWNNRALVSLQVNDLLNKANSRISSKYLNQDNAYFAQEETQYVRLGLTVNFGNFRLEDNQREIDKIERERLNSN